MTKLHTQQASQKPKVIFVCGMRRSGNHAFINWLSNALEEQQVEYTFDDKFSYLKFSKSGKTAFINDINRIRPWKRYRMFFTRALTLRKVVTLIVSAEDVNSNYGQHFQLPFWLPRIQHRIFIKRSILNTIASRLQHLKKSAAAGKGNRNLSITTKFFKKLKSWESASSDFVNWEYDLWLTSDSYRQKFLSQLGLKQDILPTISKEGGGSSFTGRDRTPTKKEATSRFKYINIPSNIRQDLMQCNIDTMLNPDEIAHLNTPLEESTAVS